MIIKFVDPTQLIPTPFNPIARTSAKAIHSLLLDIKEHGIRVPLIVKLIDNALYVADGNRRLYVALKLQLPKVPVILDVSDESLADLWRRLNSKARSMQTSDWIGAWNNLNRQRNFLPRKMQVYVDAIERYAGTPGLDLIVGHGISPMIWTPCRLLHNTLRDRLTSRRTPSHLRILAWLINRKMGGLIRGVLRADVPSKWLVKIWGAIEHDTVWVPG